MANQNNTRPWNSIARVARSSPQPIQNRHLLMAGAQILRQQVQVALCGGDLRMPKHHRQPHDVPHPGGDNSSRRCDADDASRTSARRVSPAAGAALASCCTDPRTCPGVRGTTARIEGTASPLLAHSETALFVARTRTECAALCVPSRTPSRAVCRSPRHADAGSAPHRFASRHRASRAHEGVQPPLVEPFGASG